MKFKEFLLHMLTFGRQRTQKAHKEECEGGFFPSTQNIDLGLFGKEKKGCISLFPQALAFPGLQPVGEESK